ncbi:hypothetical protein EPUS_00066 [Endocarpon pusillum Z07020]|uniref:Rhodopsin domain-containing protein n=1 Tax=Endocarpon pusillum (strain Z07020 / HMAS-L-300199) TaxID=1263415 RepID=U1I099_ENDPU|nr:uncharacterized protein EPUS_00066 [Endocarpon pusillum Z07020]ERF75274.1 hypothetical protein EPUS_00066 [Endocarpon pusillum Z07020]
MADKSLQDTFHQRALIDDNRSASLIACSIFFIVFPTIIVAFRFVARFMRKLPLGLDDYFTLPALVFVILLCVLNILSTNYGVGKHVIAANPATIYVVVKIGYFIAMAYTWVHFFVKWSILLLYRRIFGMHKKWFRIAFWSIGVYVTCWALSLFIVALTYCQPISFFWLRATPAAIQGRIDGKCGPDAPKVVQFTNAFNSVADFALLIVPFVALRKLQIKFHRKIELIAIFTIGAFACAAGLVRFAASLDIKGLTTDFTWVYSAAYNWTAIEAGIGLVCACFPVIAPLFKAQALQQRYKIVLETLRSSRAGSRIGFRWFRSRNSSDNAQGSRSSEGTLHKKLPVFSNCTTCGYSLDGKSELPPLPPAPRFREAFQGRQLLHPGLGDPRVVNEVYRGVEPGNMGLDKDRKPLPMEGIKVRTHIETANIPN